MVEQAQEFIRRQTGTYYNLFNQPPEQNLEDFIGKLKTALTVFSGGAFSDDITAIAFDL